MEKEDKLIGCFLVVIFVAMPLTVAYRTGGTDFFRPQSVLEIRDQIEVIKYIPSAFVGSVEMNFKLEMVANFVKNVKF